MLGTLLGLPLSTLVGERFGWRAAFWTLTAITVIAAVTTWFGVARIECAEGGGDFRQEFGVFKKPKLWLVLSTSTLIIGATFSAFSYFNPILTDLAGFSTGTVPVLAIGLVLNTVFLTGFALLADLPAAAVICMMGIGLVGVTLKPAMATRVQRTGNGGPLLNTVHSSFITLGIILGSSIGAVVIDNWGLRAPLWLGAAMALVGLATVLPDLARRSTPTTGLASNPAEQAERL
ncbi:hypothetical protein [Streptomyces sp. Ru71]|uniref:hypothetical protein n=1 Tax=Streptomyces sp. Ru71 TaxID=2080746 RepID=UPI0026AE6A2A